MRAVNNADGARDRHGRHSPRAHATHTTLSSNTMHYRIMYPPIAIVLLYELCPIIITSACYTTRYHLRERTVGRMRALPESK